MHDQWRLKPTHQVNPVLKKKNLSLSPPDLDFCLDLAGSLLQESFSVYLCESSHGEYSCMWIVCHSGCSCKGKPCSVWVLKQQLSCAHHRSDSWHDMSVAESAVSGGLPCLWTLQIICFACLWALDKWNHSACTSWVSDFFQRCVCKTLPHCCVSLYIVHSHCCVVFHFSETPRFTYQAAAEWQLGVFQYL